MAVPVHVSRVSKEYAPHGYSVMQDINVCVGRVAGNQTLASTIATVAAGETVAVLPLDDADVYIEGAWIYCGYKTGTHDGSNAFEFDLNYADNDGSLSNPVAFSGSGLRSDGTAAKTLVSFDVDRNQSIPARKVMYLTISEHGDVAALAIDGLSLLVRYRRKA